jgi:hypothetical protein
MTNTIQISSQLEKREGWREGEGVGTCKNNLRLSERFEMKFCLTNDNIFYPNNLLLHEFQAGMDKTEIEGFSSTLHFLLFVSFHFVCALFAVY